MYSSTLIPIIFPDALCRCVRFIDAILFLDEKFFSFLIETAVTDIILGMRARFKTKQITDISSVYVMEYI